MDLMHIPEFGNHKYVHTQISTYSSYIFVKAELKDNTRMVIVSMKTIMLVMNVPYAIKTDNRSVENLPLSAKNGEYATPLQYFTTPKNNVSLNMLTSPPKQNKNKQKTATTANR
jgi:transcription antitermination factor NusG